MTSVLGKIDQFLGKMEGFCNWEAALYIVQNIRRLHAHFTFHIYHFVILHLFSIVHFNI
jgi:hypothetical protein